MTKIIVECKIPTPTVPQIRIPEESTILCATSVMDPKKRLVNIFLYFIKHIIHLVFDMILFPVQCLGSTM